MENIKETHVEFQEIKTTICEMKIKLLGVIIKVIIKRHSTELGLGISISEILDLRAIDITMDKEDYFTIVKSLLIKKA